MDIRQLRKELLAKGVEKKLRPTIDWDKYCELRNVSRNRVRKINNEIEDAVIRFGSENINKESFCDDSLPEKWVKDWQEIKNKYNFSFIPHTGTIEFLELKEVDRMKEFIVEYEVESMDVALALWAYDPCDERIKIVDFRPGPLLSPDDIIYDENEEYFYAQYLYSLIRESKEEYEKLWGILLEMEGK